MRQEKLEELNKIIEEFKTTEVFEPDIDKNEKFLTTKIRKFKLKNGKILESVYLYELNNIAKLELSINDKIDKIKAIKELGQ